MGVTAVVQIFQSIMALILERTRIRQVVGVVGQGFGILGAAAPIAVGWLLHGSVAIIVAALVGRRMPLLVICELFNLCRGSYFYLSHEK